MQTPSILPIQIVPVPQVCIWASRQSSLLLHSQVGGQLLSDSPSSPPRLLPKDVVLHHCSTVPPLPPLCPWQITAGLLPDLCSHTALAALPVEDRETLSTRKIGDFPIFFPPQLLVLHLHARPVLPSE